MERWPEKLALLQEGYRKASESKKAEMEAKFTENRRQLAQTVKPRLIESAKNLYRLKGKDDKDLQGFLRNVLLEKFSLDNWEGLRELTLLLEQSGVDEPQLDLFEAIAAYGLNDFEIAQENISKADEAGLLKFPEDPDAPELVKRRIEIGRQVKDTVAEYLKFWEEEKALREAEAKADDLPRVKLETTKGDIIIELFENEAPNTVANFVSLVEKGYYDGIAFHRVLPGFMAQGGDPTGTGGGGPGYRIRCECHQDKIRRHFTGSLSMAHAGRDTGGSQFFITFRPTAHLNGGHTVFGRVIEGLDLLSELQRVDPSQRSVTPPNRDAIIKATVVRKRDHVYQPETLSE